MERLGGRGRNRGEVRSGQVWIYCIIDTLRLRHVEIVSKWFRECCDIDQSERSLCREFEAIAGMSHTKKGDQKSELVIVQR